MGWRQHMFARGLLARVDHLGFEVLEKNGLALSITDIYPTRER